MGRARAVGVVLLALVVVGCTPSSSEPPNPTLTPALPTPSESEIEKQQRLDFEAAEKSYREFRDEYNAIAERGGSKSSTAGMKNNAAGPYLTSYTELVQAYAKLHYRQRGVENLVYLRPGLHSPSRLLLNGCQDTRDAKTYDKEGKLVGGGDVRTLVIDMRRIDQRWKIWKADGTVVKSCPDA